MVYFDDGSANIIMDVGVLLIVGAMIWLLFKIK